MTGDELAERGTDKWIKEHTCPFCKGLVERHWTLKFTQEELETWNTSGGVCTRTRGEVEALIRGGVCVVVIEESEKEPALCTEAAKWRVILNGVSNKMCEAHAERARDFFGAIAEPLS